MKTRYFRYVPYHLIEAHLSMGWIAIPPTFFDRLHLYGIVMEWICDCPPPTFKEH